MGLPMVRRLVAGRWDVTAFARRAEVRSQCELAGASSSGDLNEAVREADVVVLCLFSDVQIRELAFGPDGFLSSIAAGALLISHTTGSPALVRQIAEEGSERGIRVVDAPVSGSARDIEEGHVTVLVGGNPEDIASATAVVAAYGDPVLAIGPLGGALVVKLLNNALFAAHVQLAGEVERVAAGFGVDMSTVAPALLQSSGASYALDVVARWGSIDKVAASAGPFLAKDLAVVDTVVLELGLDLGVLGLVNSRGRVNFRSRQEGN
jgi:3-hydroxyisobutyrate dehydrogenase-like beta-hydroxyacid dehydrogenase